MYTEWETEDDDGVIHRSFKPPWWYDKHTHEPCPCGAQPKILDYHEGYSDSIYQRLRCTVHDYVWTTFLEG